MTENVLLGRLSLPDRLRLLAFDARLTRTPEPLVAAIWDAIAQLERPASTSGRRPNPRRGELARVQADLNLAADDIDAEEMTL